MGCVAGVDGCRRGWFAVFFELKRRAADAHRFNSLPDILQSKYRPRLVALDMPIGLLDEAVFGGRQCDREARLLLGRPRGSSVFNPPVRAALRQQGNFPAALEANRESSAIHLGLAKQSFALIPKINEVDKLLNTEMQKRIFEIHPELCFYEMDGHQPMRHSKKAKGKVGIKERLRVLASTELGSIAKSLLQKRPDWVSTDDALDACAACWTAIRLALGQAERIPAKPPIDKRRLRMEMWR